MINPKKFNKISDEGLSKITGGSAVQKDKWATVGGLKSSMLAMRTQPANEYSNVMSGGGLENGDMLQIKGAPVIGSDGRTYVMAYSPKTGMSGYVNTQFLL